MTTTSKNLTELLDQMEAAGDCDDDNISVGELIDEFGAQGSGVVLLLVSLLALGPTGAIPGASIACAVLTIVFAGQLLFGGGKPWVPARIRSARASRSKIERTTQMFKVPAKYIDYVVVSRMDYMFAYPLNLIAPVALILLALAYFPLALIPLAVSFPAATACLVALGIAFKDGVFLIFGYALTAILPFIAYLALG